MSDSVKSVNNAVLNALGGADATKSSSGQVKKNDSVGKDEFLMMLVEQLKNQDPMDPMKPEQFAVNLAQFSQVEQLMNINKTLENGSNAGGGGASLAAYLGQQVAFESDTVDIKNHDAGKLALDLVSKQSDVRVDILNIDGSVKETIEVGELAAGKHEIDLSSLETEQGQFQVKVTAQGSDGVDSELSYQVAGTVTGFVPGIDPYLLVGDREVKPSEIKQVMLGSKDQAL